MLRNRRNLRRRLTVHGHKPSDLCTLLPFVYAVKQQLVKKGVLAGKSKSEAAEASAAFVPVRVAQPATTAVEIACRLVHPSGWTIECADPPLA